MLDEGGRQLGAGTRSGDAQGRAPDGLLQAIKEGRPAYVVEGEKDADNGTARLPGTAFTCNPCGASQWKPDYRYARWFAGAKAATVVVDRDAAGRRGRRSVR